jgi:two-component system, NarL family, invasion response regulator UvrY
MNQITVLFVDNHPLIRKAWSFLLSQDMRFELMADCECLESAVELLGKSRPDVIIIDNKLRGWNDTEAIELVRKSFPSLKVITLSFDIRLETAQKMIQSGAMGYLTKISPPEEIFKAIIEVHNGGTYICQETVAV